MQGWRVPQAALRRVGTRAVLGPQRLEVQLLGGCSPPRAAGTPCGGHSAPTTYFPATSRPPVQEGLWLPLSEPLTSCHHQRPPLQCPRGTVLCLFNSEPYLGGGDSSV